MDAHEKLSQFVSWEIRRIDWLCSTNAANACWDGVVLTSSENEEGVHDGSAWATGGALVHAPAHMGAFATHERVRLVGEVQTSPFSCYIGAVRVTNVLLELLRTGRLVLDKIGTALAWYGGLQLVERSVSCRWVADQPVHPWTLHPNGRNARAPLGRENLARHGRLSRVQSERHVLIRAGDVAPA